MKFSFETMPDVTPVEGVTTAILTVLIIVGALYVLNRKFKRSLR